LRADALVSKLKVARVVFGVSNAAKAAFERRNVCSIKENTVKIDESRRFTSRWACFDGKSGVRCIPRVKCSKNSV
jgi:hypothetical protein